MQNPRKKRKPKPAESSRTWRCTCGVRLELPDEVTTPPRCPRDDRTKFGGPPHKMTIAREVATRKPSSVRRRRPPRRGGRKREGEISVVDDMEGMVKNLFKNDLTVGGYKIIETDDETGEVIREEETPPLYVRPEHMPTKPTVQNVTLDAEGNVTGMTIQPEEWPPKRMPGETF